MKKLYILSLYLLLLSFSFTACKKDALEELPPVTDNTGNNGNPGGHTGNTDDNDNTPYGTPVKDLIRNKNIIDSLFVYKGGNYELGVRFYSSANHVITHLGCYAPVKGTLKVSLWDFDTKTLLATTSINADSTSFVYGRIPEIAIQAGKSYMLSFNNNISQTAQEYLVGTSAQRQPIYPLRSGDFIFDGTYFQSSYIPVFPANMVANEQINFPGIVDLRYKLTNAR